MEQSAKWRYLTYIKLPSHSNNPPRAFSVLSLSKGYRYAAQLTKDLANSLLSQPSLSFHPLLSDHVREVGLPLPSHRLIVDGCETRLELCDDNEAVENVTNPGIMYARLRRAWCKTLASWYVLLARCCSNLWAVYAYSFSSRFFLPSCALPSTESSSISWVGILRAIETTSKTVLASTKVLLSASRLRFMVSG